MSGADIRHGDWVVVRRQPDADEGDIVVAMVDAEAAVRTFRRSGGHVWLMPYNPSYPAIRGDEASILGRVIPLASVLTTVLDASSRSVRAAPGGRSGGHREHPLTHRQPRAPRVAL
jgi:hypothetical protein